jgi:hypothetical protein
MTVNTNTNTMTQGNQTEIVTLPSGQYRVYILRGPASNNPTGQWFADKSNYLHKDFDTFKQAFRFASTL